MKLIITIVLIIIILLTLLYNLFINRKLQLKKIVKSMKLIERYPEDINNYDRFIKAWKQSGYSTTSALLKKGYYQRILTICAENSSNLQSWKLLKEVLMKDLILLKEPEKRATLELLINSITQQLDNQPIKDKIMQIVMLFVRTNQGKMEFINHWFSRSMLLLEKASAKCYIIDLPVNIYNLNKYRNKYKINIDLISFQMSENDFKVFTHTIVYELPELFKIFLKAVENHEAQILINLIPRKLWIYDYSHPRMKSIQYLQNFYYEYININHEIAKLDDEITKIEFLLKMIKKSELDNYNDQIQIYQKNLNLLRDTKEKGNHLQNKCFHTLQECTLNLYLEDIEPHLFKVEDQSINWEESYQIFQKDYGFFTSMMEECNKLENNTTIDDNL